MSFGRQLEHDGICKDGFVGMLDGDVKKTEVLPVLQVGLGEQVFDVEIDGGAIYRDEPAGQVLDAKLVKETRMKKLVLFKVNGAWVKEAMDEARWQTGRPPTSAWWVDVNMGEVVGPMSDRAVSRSKYGSLETRPCLLPCRLSWSVIQSLKGGQILGQAALAKYLSVDRVDLQFAA